MPTPWGLAFKMYRGPECPAHYSLVINLGTGKMVLDRHVVYSRIGNKKALRTKGF